ncbi:uncharacterized protein LJ264_015959 [Porphyrio hochstetteri]
MAGVVFSNGERWRQLRRFSLTVLRDFGMGRKSIEGRIQEEAQVLLQELRSTQEAPFDPTYLLSCAVSNIICSIVFGRRFDYRDGEFLELLRMMNESFQELSTPWSQVYDMGETLLKHLPGPHTKIPAAAGRDEALHRPAREEERPEPGARHPAGLHRLLPAPDGEGEGEPVLGVHPGEPGAHHHSTSSSPAPRPSAPPLRYGFLMLMKHPDVQEKVHAEIAQVIGRDRAPGGAAPQRMPYTDAVIHEIQRCSDLIPMNVPHRVTRDTLFRGYLIPKDTDVYPLLSSVLHDPRRLQTPRLLRPLQLPGRARTLPEERGLRALLLREARVPGGSPGEDGALPLPHHHPAEPPAAAAGAAGRAAHGAAGERLRQHPPPVPAPHGAPAEGHPPPPDPPPPAFLLLPVAAAALVGRWKDKRSPKQPPGPPALPLIGNLLQIRAADTCQTFRKLSARYGPVFSLRFGSERVVVVYSYELVREVLVTRGDEFTDRGRFPLAEKCSQDLGLFMSNGHAWLQTRRFTLSTLRDFGMGKRGVEEQVQEETERLLQELARTQGRPFNPAMLLSAAVGNAICRILFGRRFDYGDEEYQHVLRRLAQNFRLESSMSGQLYTILPGLMEHLPGPHQTFFQNNSFILDFLSRKVAEHEATLDPAAPRDFVDVFLCRMEQEKGNPQTVFRRDNLHSTVFDMFVAGTESTSITLRYCLMLLLQHPEVAGKVEEEIERVMGRERAPALRDRGAMAYTEAVIHEAQRFLDLVPLGFIRTVRRDTQLGGFTLPQASCSGGAGLIPGGHRKAWRAFTPPQQGPRYGARVG